MKLAKSLLLGSAAGFVMVAGAQAADLPVKAKAVEYVKVCSTYGAGFFYIPGTDTCLKIDGRVRAEYKYVDWDYADDYDLGFRGRGRLGIDARTATEYGTLRAYARYQFTVSSGAYGTWSESLDTGAGVVDRAFVQFLGITAGRTVSFFDFSEGQNWGGTGYSDGKVTNVLAYTATFGDGFALTLALEDAPRRGTLGVDHGAYYDVPDIVLALRADQSWGSAQLSFAAHEGQWTDPATLSQSDDWGYAVGLGVKIKLDALAPGDYFHFNATYTKGATNYLVNDAAGAASALRDYIAPSVYDEQVKAWGVAAGIQHWWSPQFYSYLYGYYESADLDVADYTEYKIALQNTWVPVKGLIMGLELAYVYDKLEITGLPKIDEKGYEAIIRIQRDF
ncbi:MAG: porin [Methylobacteriaceae bacterium]|jgi:hypothetical protein|nr:porin [Methylobacteriaceae bacterium]